MHGVNPPEDMTTDTPTTLAKRTVATHKPKILSRDEKFSVIRTRTLTKSVSVKVFCTRLRRVLLLKKCMEPATKLRTEKTTVLLPILIFSNWMVQYADFFLLNFCLGCPEGPIESREK